MTLNQPFASPDEMQEEGGELDSHEEVRLSFAGPGEIKKREVVLGSKRWTFFFSCYSTAVLRTLSLYAMASGHCLNIVILAAVHGLLGLPGRCERSTQPSFW